MSDWKNKLFIGDNLDVLREHIPNECVDLIYLDPPFNSNANYNILFKERNGTSSVAQITAFEDTWHWGLEAETAYRETIVRGPEALAVLLKSLRSLMGQSDMMAYLSMMAPRLAELHRTLRPTGSLYLHCDPTASHYLKALLDAVFGVHSFRNEIIWKRTSAHSDIKQGARHYGRIHDTLLFYTKGSEYTWSPRYMPYDEDYVNIHYPYVEESSGRRYGLWDITGPGGASKGNPFYEVLGISRYWRYSRPNMEEKIRQGKIIQPQVGAVPREVRYLDESPGVPIGTIWDDIPPVNSQARERLGYPTQKPESLLERIILASSNKGDIVLDPFCGCGTSIATAERLDRKWMGIDITHLAISLMKSRLVSAYRSELSPYEVIGDPKDLASARALLDEPDGRYQFQWWACGLVDAHPANDKRKGADSGVDGYLYFFDDESDKAKKVVVQVKSGHVSVRDIRDFRGVIEREGAVLGAFITLEEPTRLMAQESVSAGFYAPTAFFGQRKYPKIQILTVKNLLEGGGLRLPPAVIDTYRRAPRREKNLAKKVELIRG